MNNDTHIKMIKNGNDNFAEKYGVDSNENSGEFKGYTNGFDALYLRWLVDKIDITGKSKMYHSLLMHLFQSTFRECENVRMDVNRARDGVSLRKKFFEEKGLIFDSLGSPECSWLEMLIALSERIDDQMMYDMNLGNRTDKWFWLIIDQMELKKYTDRNYIHDEVDDILARLGAREYENGGRNGIFKCRTNVKNVEIWYQVMQFFNEIGPDIEF